MVPMSRSRGSNLVVVGCGGVTYHGMSRMVTWMNRRTSGRVTFVDPDTLEGRNKTRQWGLQEGTPKVAAACDLVRQLGHEAQGFTQRIEEVKEPVGSKFLTRSRVLVVSAPDNHQARVQTHRICSSWAADYRIEVVEITAGNGLDHGYALGCVHTSDGVCRGDWTQTHPDIVEGAQAERRAQGRPVACGELDDGGPVQSEESNHLTAGCLWSLAERMWKGWVGEYRWETDRDGVQRVFTRDRSSCGVVTRAGVPEEVTQ